MPGKVQKKSVPKIDLSPLKNSRAVQFGTLSVLTGSITVTPETRFVVEMIRSYATGNLDYLVLGRQAGLDWDLVLQEALRLKVAPLVNGLLVESCSDLVPPSVLKQFQQFVRDNTLRNLKMTAELSAIYQLCAERGIQIVPFKGPTLAALAGGDLSWRSFGDLDFFLNRNDLAEVSNLLRARGYELNLDWAATQDDRFLDVTYALEFVGRENGVMVELHWELFPRYLGFDFEFAELRQRLTTVNPGGKPMQTLAADDLLLYLCGHGAKHFWPNLNSVADVARLIGSRDDWQWEALIVMARRRNVGRVTLLGLLLAHGLLGAPVSEWIMEEAAEDKSLMRLFEATVTQMFFPKRQKSPMRRQFLYFLQLQQGWQDKLLYFLRLAVAPNIGDWEFYPLSHHWAFLYTVLRPLRLIGKYLSF